MNLVELDVALRKLRLSGMADVLDARFRADGARPVAVREHVDVLLRADARGREAAGPPSRCCVLSCDLRPDELQEANQQDERNRLTQAKKIQQVGCRSIGRASCRERVFITV